MARFCSECGTALPPNAAFCPSCGHATSSVPPQENWEVMVGGTVPHQEVPPPPPPVKEVHPPVSEQQQRVPVQPNTTEAHHGSLMGPALIQGAMGIVTALMNPDGWSTGFAIALSLVTIISGLLAGRKRGVFSTVLKSATWLLMLLNGVSLLSILVSASELPTDILGLIAFAVPSLANFISCYRTLRAFSK